MLGDFPQYARRITGTPHKHIGICTEKVDKHGFLFGVEVSTDRQRLAVGVVGVEWDLLGAFRRLEVAHMVLQLWCLSGKGLESRGKLGGALDRLPVLNAFSVAFVGVLVGGTDGDDPLRSSHLQFEVRVVGDCHELGVPWVTDDGVVGALETHHLESQSLLPEVGRRAKADR